MFIPARLDGSFTHPQAPDHIIARLKNKQVDAAEADQLLKVHNYLARHPNMPLKFRDAMLRDEVMFGMTVEQVQVVRPGLTRIHRIITPKGSSEIWSKKNHDGTYNTSYHFDLEILTAVTE